MDSKHAPMAPSTLQLMHPPFETTLTVFIGSLSAVVGLTLSESVQATTINSSNSTVVLQTLDPTSSTFDVPATSVIDVFPGEGISGDNSKDWQLTNRGSVKGLVNGINLGSATAGGLRLENFGSIIAQFPGGTGSGVFLSNGGTVINHVGASITSTDFYGVLGGSDPAPIIVINDGDIFGASGALRLGGGGSVTQGVSGTLRSDNGAGIINDGGGFTINNAGSIVSAAPAIVVRGNSTGTISNTGTLQGQFGVLLQSSQVTLSNAGTITGTTGTAVSMAGNNNKLILQTGSVLNGNVSSSGSGNTLELQGTGNANNNFSGLASISQLSSGTWTLGGALTTNAASPSALNVQQGTLVINGQLTQGATGGTSVSNGGTLLLGSGASLTSGLPVQVGTGSLLGGYGTVNGDVNLLGTLAIADAAPLYSGGAAGDFTVNGNLTNSGEIRMDSVLPASSLIVRGNYVGNGGALTLSSVLAGDQSASDKLVIDGGNASGSTRVNINNAGGAGAVTTGNGILVVDTLNSGTTTATAFQLGSRVVAGPYEYTLQRASVDGSNAQAWYLRSTIEPTPPTPPTPPSPPGPPTPTPPTPTPPQPATPNYRAETSLYGAVPALALVYSRALIDTLHERVGEERSSGSATPADSQTVGPSLGWGRMIYRSGEQDRGSSNGFGIGNTPEYNYDLNAFQVGLDLYRHERNNGAKDQAGVSLAVGTLDGGVKHTTGENAGDDKLHAYSLGAYWTHFGPEGWYVDGVLQLNRFDIDAKPNGLDKLNTTGWGYTASLEGGYPFQVSKDLSIEPQLQVIYSNVNLDDSHDIGANVSFEDVDSLIGRAGVRFAKDWFRDDQGAERRTSLWVRPSVWREFKGQPKTEFSSQNGSVPFEANIDGSWGEVNLGVDVQADKRTTFYMSAGYQQAFDGDSHGYEGMLGVKVAF
ncbi:autotransporter outer membrane beta-barrel domain-containing protein [Pseudomonas sp. NPDC086278]|uniref:autotransporter family protein n=1 Tax=Pseudomonas sp. NPDC086278 TaxID=3390646 RepID=UPI003D05B114